MAPALRSYWRNSLPACHRRISAIYAQLIQRAADDHAPLIAASDSETLMRRAGYRSVFRNTALLDAAAVKAEQMQSDYGIRFRLEDRDAPAASELALKLRLAGAICYSIRAAVSSHFFLRSLSLGHSIDPQARWSTAFIRCSKSNK
jgi:D-amino-acid dehydrogenase